MNHVKTGGYLSVDKREEISDWYDTYSASILSFILLMVRDYQQAEDLTQETFVKAYVYRDTFKRQSSEKTWLFSIAHNVTVDYLRKRKPLLVLKEIFLIQEDKAPLPDEKIELKEESHELYKGLSKMKDSYRKVIILRKIKGFSIEDTAMILKWSESKVKSTLSRALLSLKKELIKEGYWDEEAVRRF
ncbi:RNA polymerase sigma factor [Methanobrevibacter sp.]|jgi:RNA polymerase sigma-70 factor (ECF subfamily)|uniref:RNA polymerase sigma factor n=1 Tax=Methanobrevibacter sp. TaxID=66852 RepID=UPI00388FC2F5